MTRLFRSNPSSISDELLSAYIDGQLSSAERQLVERALAVDLDVQQRLQAMKTTVHLLRQMPALTPPRAFVLSETQVMARGGRELGRRGRGGLSRLLPSLMPLATAAVAVALIVVLGMDYLASPAAAPAPAALQAESVAKEAPPQEMPQTLRALPQATAGVIATTEVMKEVEIAQEKPQDMEMKAEAVEAPAAESAGAVAPAAVAAEEAPAAMQAEADQASKQLAPTAVAQAEQPSVKAVPEKAPEEAAPSEEPAPLKPVAPPSSPRSPAVVANPFLPVEVALAVLLALLLGGTLALRRK